MRASAGTRRDTDRLLQLDGLRGLFSIMVAIHHFALYFHFKSGLSVFIIREADLFVDFFFVLSGFVIGLNYHDAIKSVSDFKSYLHKRLLRLYPLLFYTVMLFFLFQVLSKLAWPELLNNSRSFSALAAQTADSLLFTNSTLLITSGPGMNYPSWSISAEMISYIVFGGVVWTAAARKTVILMIIFLVAALSLLAIGDYKQTSEWGFLRGISCFITGYFAFTLYKRNDINIKGNYAELFSVALIVAVLYLRANLQTLKEEFTLASVPLVFGIAVYIFSCGTGHISRLLRTSPLQWLGKISYSVYLNHAIVLIIISKMAFSVASLHATGNILIVVLLIYIIAILVYSHFTYLFIERKFKQS